MAVGQGSAVIDFGAFPGSNEASVAVTGIATISNTSKVEAYVMADDTQSPHTANDHRYFNLLAQLSCGTPTTGVGFTIYATSLQKLQGPFKVRFVWAD